MSLQNGPIEPISSLCGRVLNVGQDVNAAKLQTFLLRKDVTLEERKVASDYLALADQLRRLPSYRHMLSQMRKDEHCIRCHTLYTEEANNWHSCTIPHVFRSPIDAMSVDESVSTHVDDNEEEHVAEYDSLCCGDRVKLKVYVDGTQVPDTDQPCFWGKHTTNVKAVIYNDPNVKACHVIAEQCITKCPCGAEDTWILEDDGME
ncbi:hypothetical protein DL96DRAFT_1593450 [Flagelloscypha sp. PMI_526]|nr:hypothetical protein DL96DRAFT_1593450 [Flagelloscypha sp. PMI_526]